MARAKRPTVTQRVITPVREYAYDLWYNNEWYNNEATPRTIPNMSSRTFATEAALEADLLAYIRDLERQEYSILKVERRDICARCSGSGRVRVRPKGWRGRTPAPWYMLREIVCPSCVGMTRRDPLACERWAAVRVSLCGEYLDLSTLSDTGNAARALADRRDAQNRMAIRRDEALPHARVTRVRIEEVR